MFIFEIIAGTETSIVGAGGNSSSLSSGATAAAVGNALWLGANFIVGGGDVTTTAPTTAIFNITANAPSNMGADLYQGTRTVGQTATTTGTTGFDEWLSFALLFDDGGGGGGTASNPGRRRVPRLTYR
jgi:hypothetical protein